MHQHSLRLTQNYRDATRNYSDSITIDWLNKIERQKKCAYVMCIYWQRIISISCISVDSERLILR